MSARTFRISELVYLIRVEDRKVKYFEGLWGVSEGITYNSYVVFGPERIVLLDTVKGEFVEDYINALSSIVDIKKIDAIVIHHLEPDHSGSLPRILGECPNAMVYGHQMAKVFIEGYHGVKLERFTAVTDGYTLDLGYGHSLRFFHTSWVHWPETIMSLYEPRGVLFSGDVFGAYFIPPYPTDEQPDDFEGYRHVMREYLATIVGKFRNWVKKNIEKILSHGIRPSIIASYTAWS